MLAKDAVTEEEFASWIRAPDAIGRLNAKHDTDAIQQIVMGLQSGAVRAIAEEAFVYSQPGKADYVEISETIWRKHEDESFAQTFWRTGNLILDVWYEQLRKHAKNSFIDVRFHPDDIAKIPGASAPKQDGRPSIEVDHATIIRRYGTQMKTRVMSHPNATSCHYLRKHLLRKSPGPHPITCLERRTATQRTIGPRSMKII